MLVRAKEREFADGMPCGYYDYKRRYAGEVFTLKDEKHFSEKWMEKVEDGPEPVAKPKKASHREPVGYSHMQKKEIL